MSNLELQESLVKETESQQESLHKLLLQFGLEKYMRLGEYEGIIQLTVYMSSNSFSEYLGKVVFCFSETGEFLGMAKPGGNHE
jgi:hypothetical protein